MFLLVGTCFSDVFMRHVFADPAAGCVCVCKYTSGGLVMEAIEEEEDLCAWGLFLNKPNIWVKYTRVAIYDHSTQKISFFFLLVGIRGLKPSPLQVINEPLVCHLLSFHKLSAAVIYFFMELYTRLVYIIESI